MKPTTFLDNYNIHFNTQEKQDMERDLRELVSQVVREQREICRNVKRDRTFHETAEWAFREGIKNAPEPEFQ